MNITVEDVAACRKKLNIEVPADEVDREWKGVVVEFQKYAQIPGFRAGKAPASVLEKKFEKEISDEVQRKLIPQSFREAIAKEKLKVVSMPNIEEIHFSRKEPLRFHATIDVAPTFALPTYKGLKVKKAKVNLTDEDVENTIKMIADQQASFEDVKDRGIKLGDFAVISYTGTSDGKPLTEFSAAAKPLAENKQFWLLVAKDSFVPGFCDPLIGAKSGDKKEIKITFPKEFRIKELADLKADYSVEVLGVKEKKLPPLDDEFAKKYNATTMDELRKRIQDNLQKDREGQAEREARNQIVEQLLKAVTFDLPAGMVEHETKSAMMDIVRENQMRGLGDQSIREKSQEILDFAQQNAKDKVKASFILTRIAEEEKVQVKDEELQQQVQLMAQQSGKPLAEVAKRLQETGEIESVREQIQIGRTLDLLMSHATVETE